MCTYLKLMPFPFFDLITIKIDVYLSPFPHDFNGLPGDEICVQWILLTILFASLTVVDLWSCSCCRLAGSWPLKQVYNSCLQQLQRCTVYTQKSIFLFSAHTDLQEDHWKHAGMCSHMHHILWPWCIRKSRVLSLGKFTAKMLALNLLCHLICGQHAKWVPLLNITPLSNDQFVSFLFYNKQERVLSCAWLDWTFEYHSFVFKNIINPGQLLFDSSCMSEVMMWLMAVPGINLLDLWPDNSYSFELAGAGV